ncbi:MAG: cupin domain-containing protein [Alphaproteobacteria bacterium]|nr:cupin domain-containing protein [Alphaproteobacteria bacterium]
MADHDRPKADPEALAALHEKAEAMAATYRYAKPEKFDTARAAVKLAETDLLRARVVVLKPGQGENNLHYHTGSDSFWMVLRGRAAFYGPGDEPIGEFGPLQGTTTPRFFRYWFKNAGTEDLEMLHLFAHAKPGKAQKTGRTDAAPRKAYTPQSAEVFDAGG